MKPVESWLLASWLARCVLSLATAKRRGACACYEAEPPDIINHSAAQNFFPERNPSGLVRWNSKPNYSRPLFAPFARTVGLAAKATARALSLSQISVAASENQRCFNFLPCQSWRSIVDDAKSLGVSKVFALEICLKSLRGKVADLNKNLQQEKLNFISLNTL